MLKRPYDFDSLLANYEQSYSLDNHKALLDGTATGDAGYIEKVKRGNSHVVDTFREHGRLGLHYLTYIVAQGDIGTRERAAMVIGEIAKGDDHIKGYISQRIIAERENCVKMRLEFALEQLAQ